MFVKPIAKNSHFTEEKTEDQSRGVNHQSHISPPREISELSPLILIPCPEVFLGIVLGVEVNPVPLA